MKNYVYFYYGKAVNRYQYGENETKEDVMEYVSNSDCFGGWATKKEFDQYVYDRAFFNMKQAYDKEDLEYIFGVLSVNDNRASKKAFQVLAGIKLGSTWKERKQQLIEYYGEKYNKYLSEQEKQRKEEEEKEKKEGIRYAENIKKCFLNKEYITGVQFIKLCEYSGIQLYKRTKDYCNKKLEHINIEGCYRIRGGKSKGLIDAFWDLKKRLTGKE